jgi:hypothetical protein
MDHFFADISAADHLDLLLKPVKLEESHVEVLRQQEKIVGGLLWLFSYRRLVLHFFLNDSCGVDYGLGPALGSGIS